MTIKVLVFSSLYPNSRQPRHGIFVETRLRQLKKVADIECRVMAPVPWVPLSHPILSSYAKYATVPAQEVRYGIEIFHPRYLVIPKVGMSVAPWLMAKSVLPAVKKMLNGGFIPDVIDAHYFYPDGVAAAHIAKRLNKPLTITARGTDLNLIADFVVPNRWIKWAANIAGKVITVSQSLAKKAKQIGIEESKITVLRNGVDTEFFASENYEQARTRLNIEKKAILCVGNLVELKGFDLVIEAMQMLPDSHLYLAGDGEKRQQWQFLAESRHVQDRVHFLGLLTQEQLRSYYSAVDTLVLPSSREGWPNVLLEANACGTPVVATNVGAVPEIITEPIAGIIMQERTPAAIASAIKTIFDNKPSRERTVAHAKKYSWKQTSMTQIEIFQELIDA